MTWTPDGKNIVYRNRISDGFDGIRMAVDRSKTVKNPKKFAIFSCQTQNLMILYLST